MSKFTVLAICGLIAACAARNIETSSNADPWNNWIPAGVRIVGGSEAERGEFPYQARLLCSDSFCCSSTIIDVGWVVTAAHCVVDGIASRYRIVAGDHSQSQIDPNEQIRSVSEVILHPGYVGDATAHRNDIALLRLSSPLTLNEWVTTIPMARPGSSPTGDSVASGWGRTSAGGSIPDILKKVTLGILSDEICTEQYGAAEIDRTMICAGGVEGHNVCSGDSGGPLTCTSTGVVGTGSKFFCGIACKTALCALPNQSGVFTEVSYFSTWVTNTINSAQ